LNARRVKHGVGRFPSKSDFDLGNMTNNALLGKLLSEHKLLITGEAVCSLAVVF